MFSLWKKKVLARNIDESLRHAAGAGDMVKVKRFLELHADINAQDEHGWTALHRAIDGRHKDIANLLIAKGADVTIRDFVDNSTPLHWIEVKEEAELLIAHGAEIDAKNRFGITPLHMAVMGGCLEVVEVLINYGANIAEKTDEGLTAVGMALSRQQTEIAGLLLKQKNGEANK